MNDTESEVMGRNAAALRLGLSGRQVTRLAQKGVLTDLGGGKFPSLMATNRLGKP